MIMVPWATMALSSLRSTMPLLLLLAILLLDVNEPVPASAAAVLLFLAGSGGGFALTRLAAGATLLDDPDRRQRMSKLGRERFLELLSWEHQAGPYTAVFQRLLARRMPVRIPRQRTGDSLPARERQR